MTVGFTQSIPRVSSDMSGSFSDSHCKELKSSAVGVAIVIGAGLGKAARWFANNATIAYAIDTWEDEKSFETFCATSWGERIKMIPIRGEYTEVIEQLSRAGVIPDIIYVEKYTGRDLMDVIAVCDEQFSCVICGPYTLGQTNPYVEQGALATERELRGGASVWTLTK